MSSGTGIQHPTMKNPMELGPIIKCVFEYSSIKDIKEFRFVSREWNSVSQPFLRRRCKISFHKKDESKSDRDRTPSSFAKIFSQSEKILAFSSFKFSNSRGLAPNETHSFWTESELLLFCQIYSTEISELEFSFVDIHAPELKEIYDMTDLLSNLELVKATGKSKTKFKILSGWTEHTRFQVSLQVLNAVKEISLSRCQVTIPDCTENIRMKPIALHLTDVRIIQKGSFVPQLPLNDIVDFSGIQELFISYLGEQYTEFTLDSKSFKNADIQLHSLTLNWLRFPNAQTFQSELRIQKVVLYNTPFVQKNKLLVQDFELHNSKVDLFALPISTEKLTITTSPLVALSLPVLLLPNLKFLKFLNIRFEEEDLSSITSRFVDCPNIATLTLMMPCNSYAFSASKLSLDVSLIPKSVQRMKFRNVLLQNVSNVASKTEILVLDEFSLTQADALNYFQTNTLVLNRGRDCDLKNEDMLHFLTCFRPAESLPLVIYVEAFCWKQTDDDNLVQFQGSPFASFVDRESEYYIFKKGKGSAITAEDFAKVAELK